MEEYQRNFEGIFIPAFIWLDNRLNALDKVILMEINSLDNGEEGCYASNDYLATFCNCTATKVSTTITKLKKLDFIEQESFDGRKRILKIKNQTLKNLKADFKKFKQIDNNILINNSNNINIITTETEKEINQPKKRISKKQQNYIDIYNMLEEFTTNIKVKDALKKYLKVRTTERSLNVEQWNIILTNLRNECGTDTNHALQLIEQATACGWMQIVYPNKFNGKPKSSYSSKPTFDNTAEHNLGNKPITDDEFDSLSFKEKQNYVIHINAYKNLTNKQEEFYIEYCAPKDENGNLLEF